MTFSGICGYHHLMSGSDELLILMSVRNVVLDSYS